MSLEIVFEKGRQQIVLAKVSDHAGAVDWFKRRMQMDPTTRRWERVFLRSSSGQRTDVTEEILTMARDLCVRSNPINYAAKACPRGNPSKPWVVATVFDRGPGHHYRYQVTGENLNHPVGHPDRHFTWSIPAISDQYDTSRAVHVKQVQYARSNPSKYAGGPVDSAAHSSVVPWVLIAGGLAGLIYTFTRSSTANASTPPASGKTAPVPNTVLTPPSSPELPLPSPLVQARPIVLLGQRVDPAVAVMQAQLSNLGFGSLKHDGVSGPATRTAMGAFLIANAWDTADGMTAFVNRHYIPVLPSDPAAALYAIDYVYRQANGIASADRLGPAASSSA